MLLDVVLCEGVGCCWMLCCVRVCSAVGCCVWVSLDEGRVG